MHGNACHEDDEQSRSLHTVADHRVRVFLATFKSFPSQRLTKIPETHVSSKYFPSCARPRSTSTTMIRSRIRRGINDTRASRRIERRTTPNIGRERTDMKATEETRKRSSDWIVGASGGNLSVDFGILRRVFPLFHPMDTLHTSVGSSPVLYVYAKSPDVYSDSVLLPFFFYLISTLFFSLSSSPNRYSLSTTVRASLVHAHLFTHTCVHATRTLYPLRGSLHTRDDVTLGAVAWITRWPESSSGPSIANYRPRGFASFRDRFAPFSSSFPGLLPTRRRNRVRGSRREGTRQPPSSRQRPTIFVSPLVSRWH